MSPIQSPTLLFGEIIPSPVLYPNILSAKYYVLEHTAPLLTDISDHNVTPHDRTFLGAPNETAALSSLLDLFVTILSRVPEGIQ